MDLRILAPFIADQFRAESARRFQQRDALYGGVSRRPSRRRDVT